MTYEELKEAHQIVKALSSMMSTPQKLGLDVVVDRLTGDLVTLEVNGFHSGYRGMSCLGDYPEHSIVSKIGLRAEKGSILVHPWTHEFYGDGGVRENIKRLKQYFGIEMVFSSIISETIEQPELEAILSRPLNSFKCIIGFGEYLKANHLETLTKMINRPLLEELTHNKFLQYLMLRPIPQLNMPKTAIIDQELNFEQISAMIKKYGKIVRKPIDGSQGDGVYVTDEKYLARYSDLIVEGMKDLEIELRLDKTRFVKTKLFQEIVCRLTKENPPQAEKIGLERYKNQAQIIQRYVDTLPVISTETRLPHFARARLLWFGEYLGGYWALSKKPINHEGSSPIVNYSKTNCAQRFTPCEEEIFRDYANSVFPIIIHRATIITKNQVDYYVNKLNSQFLQAVCGKVEEI